MEFNIISVKFQLTFPAVRSHREPFFLFQKFPYLCLNKFIMENNVTYVQFWRITVGILFLLIGLVLAFWAPIYWYNHDMLTRMQLLKEIWYMPVGAFICILIAKYQVEKFKKLNPKTKL